MCPYSEIYCFSLITLCTCARGKVINPALLLSCSRCNLCCRLPVQTSIMAVEYDGGVIIGADSRTSTGVYVANRVSDKLTEISDTIFCCRSGSSADTQATADLVKYNLSLHRSVSLSCVLLLCRMIIMFCITIMIRQVSPVVKSVS